MCSGGGIYMVWGVVIYVWYGGIKLLLSISLKTAIDIFQIVNNRGVVTQTYIQLLHRISLNEI